MSETRLVDIQAGHPVQAETIYPMNSYRWLRPADPSKPMRLQQAHRGDRGSVYWQDVPIVDEDPTP